jgi:DNA-binding PadR family transcriptional regulator
LQDEINLTPTSYVVLGLLAAAGGPTTPYDLKQRVAASVGHFWGLQHAQLYTEPERLARAGLLTEQRERGGRRRKLYALTVTGREALADWLADPTPSVAELRDPGLLQLFFGAEPKRLAAVQLDAHRRRLGEYEALSQRSEGSSRGARLVLEAGIGHEREYVRFWKRLAEGE